MKRIASLLFTAAVSAVSLTGCVVYDGYGYYEDDYYDDGYYAESYRPARSYGPSYSTTIRYSNYTPDYVYWSGYYSALWPTYRYYYDPVFCPDFYYGVTWFPVSYFGLHYSRYQWPYYHAYSPYRYSYWDNYYDWRWRDRSHNRYDRYPGNNYYRFGSARNESERIAAYTGMDRYRGLASPGVQTMPYDNTHVFGWRSEGVRGHYPTQEGPRPYFQQASVDPMDWRANQYRNRFQEPAYDNGGGRISGSAAGESAQIQAQQNGWREPAYNANQNRSLEQDRFGGNRAQPEQNPRNSWREPASRESGWVSEAPPIRGQRYSQPSEPSRDFRSQPESWGQREVTPSQSYRESTPRFEQQPEQRFEQPTQRFERYEQTPQLRTQRSERFEQPQSSRFEMPQRSEPRFERPEPRFEVPQRSEPRFERSEPRFEAPQQRSEPRFEMPQRSEPRFERPEPRFEAPSRSDSGSAAQESMRIGRSRDDEQ